MEPSHSIKMGISQQFPCSYIPEQQEQLLVVLDKQCFNKDAFDQLMQMGFRRSGDQIYRPHCVSCQQCQSLRVLTAQFQPNRQQKRLWKKASDFTIHYNQHPKEQYFELYQRYITARHADGTMYPPNKEQYEQFLFCHWLDLLFIEIHHEQKLIAVAVTDLLVSGLSAVYSFFDPEYADFSIGKYLIMVQIETCKLLNKPYLYLGYQVDNCQKMNYKAQFSPHQRLVNGRWQDGC